MTDQGMRRLRVAVLLLLLGNLVYYLWTEGLLRNAGLGPAVQTEPQRLLRQIRPEALRLQPAVAETAASSQEAPLMADPTGPCLQAGLFDEVFRDGERAHLLLCLVICLGQVLGLVINKLGFFYSKSCCFLISLGSKLNPGSI